MRITKGNSEWPACPISWLHRIRCFEDCKQEACHMLPEPKKEPFQLLGEWEPKKVTLFKKTKVSLENRTCFTSKRRSVVNWYDSSTDGWSIYLGGHFPKRRFSRVILKILCNRWFHPHVLPVASLCFWIHPPRTLQHEDWNGCLPARKEHKADKAYGQFVVRASRNSIYRNTSVNTCKHTRSSSIKAAKKVTFGIYPTQKKHICASGPASLLTLFQSNETRWCYEMILYATYYATIWYYFVMHLESFSSCSCCGLVVDSPVQGKAPHLLKGSIFQPLRLGPVVGFCEIELTILQNWYPIEGSTIFIRCFFLWNITKIHGKVGKSPRPPGRKSGDVPARHRNGKLGESGTLTRFPLPGGGGCLAFVSILQKRMKNSQHFQMDSKWKTGISQKVEPTCWSK